jgi:vitamin B12 transporter
MKSLKFSTRGFSTQGLLGVVTSIAVVAMLPAEVSAQTQRAEAGTSEVIVVTATRKPTPLERLASQVTVVDRATIEERGYVSLVDALKDVPGIIAVQNGTPGSLTSVFSRGTNSKHTLALYDGIRLNDASTPNGQYNFGQDLLGELSRVEVLRGAASSIYGSDAIGGVVNLIPRRGGDTPFEGFYDVSYGSFEALRGLLGAAGTTGALSYGLSVETVDSQGFDQVPNRFAQRTGDPDGATISVVSGSVDYDVNNWFKLDALLRYREASSEFDTFSGGPTFSLRADDPDLEVDFDRYTVWRLGGEARANDELGGRIAYGRVKNERAETNGGVRTSSAEGERDFADAIVTWTPKGTAFLRDPAVSAGLQWYDESIDIPATAFAGSLRRSESNSGVFLVAQSGLSAFFDATASIRSDDNESFGGNTTYNLGLVHQLKWLTGMPARIKAAYGTSFKAPTLNERFSTSAFNLGNTGLKPEEGETTEIGFEATVIKHTDLSLEIGVTWFDSNVKNLIEYNFGQLRNINIGRVEIEGNEAFLRFKAKDRARFEVNHTYTESVNAALASRPQLLRRPEHVWGVQAGVSPTKKIDLSLSWSFIGSRTDVNYSDAGAFLRSGGRIKGYNVGSANLTYQLTPKIDVYVSVRNIADEVYEQPESFAGAPRSTTIGVRGRF